MKKVLKVFHYVHVKVNMFEVNRIIEHIKKVFFIMLFLAVPIHIHAQVGMQDLLEKGNESFARGDYDSAVTHYFHALEVAPDNAEIHHLLGTTLFRKSEYDGAIHYFTRAAQLDPDIFLNAYFDIGESYRLNGDFPMAIESYKKVLDRDRTHSKALHGCGIALYNSGDYEGAAECFRKFLEENPGDTTASTLLGLALIETGKTSEAIEYLQKAIELDPNNRYARMNLARAFHNANRYDEAIEHYEKVIEADPDNFALYLQAGLVHHDRGDFDAAVESFSGALEIDHDIPEAYIYIGLSYSGKSDTEKAIEYFNKALQVDSNNCHAYRHLAREYSESNEYDTAIEHFMKALEIDPYHAQTFYELGMVFFESGDTVGAKECFKKAVDIDPEYVPAKKGLQGLISKQIMPKLTASAVFVDFYGEKVLYSGEKGAIDIEVRNVGNGTARNIQAVVTPLSPMKGITLGDSATLTKLMSGNTMTLKIPVMASKEVSEGEIRMRIDIKEKWGFDLNPSLEVTIKTSR